MGPNNKCLSADERIVCPLCASREIRFLFSGQRKNLIRDYYCCANCDLVFVPSVFHLSFLDQKNRYLEHNNEFDDLGYRKFLSRLKDELIPFLCNGDYGLDYGAGPGPVLAEMMTRAGYKMDLYDPIFYPDKNVLRNRYDFIVCTETAEHFVDPKADFDRMFHMLNPGGLLGLMTGILYDEIDFEHWYYRLDSSHISFYSPDTMDWISSRWDWESLNAKRDVYIFRKN